MGAAEDEGLVAAILADDLVAAQRCLEAGANPNVRVGRTRAKSPYHNPSTAPNRFLGLHLAANDDDPALATLLLRHGADADSAIYSGTLPISIAAMHGHLAVLEVLIPAHQWGASKGYCPLRVAAYAGQEAAVRRLLVAGPERDRISSALASAVARKGNLAVTRLLVDAGGRADWIRPGVDPAVQNTVRMIALQSQPEALPLFEGHAPLRLIDAATDGDIDAVERFVAGGAPLDDSDRYGHITALVGASRRGHTAVVDCLLALGARPAGPKGKADPLFAALRGGHLGTAELLWSRGVRTERMLERAILYDPPIESVLWAFEKAPDRDGALWNAVRVDHLDLVRFALERGADPSHRRQTRSPLMIAAAKRSVPIAELLIASGADLHATDGSGWTAMHHALCRWDPDDPDATFDYSDDALERPIVALLLRHGLSVPKKD
ncbi:MAG: ankyrin repeat domain-containing protein [Deltaproteobacteria bacterium]|nr:ankyrin repeat domain-containing protein [Deltaproteobacteria bacterium]